jgi:anti-anti-sigma regulatory factor
MSPPILHIQQEASVDPNFHRYSLRGIIDVDAVPLLEQLYGVPASTKVELDFAAVQRVNSMGLAQLLKLFEHWESKQIGVEVSHANRMTAMLFKITGLERFLAPGNIPEPNPASDRWRVRLKGIIDVDSVAVLEPLYNLPAGGEVELDFTEVHRVNSMGLAQLLKLFEHWQNNHIGIRARNVSGMTAMLFKMTGLDRFLTTTPTDAKPPTIKSPQPPSAAASLSRERHRFRFKGILDVEAVAILEPLYNLPPGCEVEMDFAEVLRVNSMGLAQLLKLFEHWQGQQITIRTTNVSRMTAMLFKMTGLDRFLVDEDTHHPTMTVSSNLATEGNVRLGTTAPAKPSAKPVPTVSRHSPKPDLVSRCGQLYWKVNMQSKQQLSGWNFLNTHLQHHLRMDTRLEITEVPLDVREKSVATTDLIFTKPFNAVKLISEGGFRALARPAEQCDEVTLLARAEDERGDLPEYTGGRVAAITPNDSVYLLGRYLLDESGTKSESMQYQFSGQEIKSVQMLLKGEVDLLFMHSESFRRLSGMTRSKLRELSHTKTGFAFHLWCLSPGRAELTDPLLDFLLGMDQDEQGRHVLSELGCIAWQEPIQKDMQMLEHLYTLYGNL